MSGDRCNCIIANCILFTCDFIYITVIFGADIVASVWRVTDWALPLTLAIALLQNEALQWGYMATCNHICLLPFPISPRIIFGLSVVEAIQTISTYHEL